MLQSMWENVFIQSQILLHKLVSTDMSAKMSIQDAHKTYIANDLMVQVI